ncbi:hypothetical protein JCM10207_006200 [Rhodosporidiobolus poonsookiae]
MPFTPLPSFVGGLLLSYSTSALLVGQGQLLGCSGVAHSTLSGLVGQQKNKVADKKDKLLGPSTATSPRWKLAALSGLLSGGFLLKLLQPTLEAWTMAPIFDPPISLASYGPERAIAAGFLVGVGTKLANGCTSGHMLLGLARLSKRSLAAVLTFFTTALLTSRLAPYPHLGAFTYSSFSPFRAALPAPLAYALLALPLFLCVPQLTYSLPLFRKRPAQASAVHAFSTGVVFSIGLALAGMSRPSKVLAFFYLPLSIPGAPPPPAAWDPSLAMVALGGLLPNVAVWQAVKGWRTPMKGTSWNVPRGENVDARLLVGAALFGVGWGLSGICPGPLFAVLGTGPSISGTAIPAFAGAFAAGGLVVERFL